jgi:hypothetical protein
MVGAGCSVVGKVAAVFMFVASEWFPATFWFRWVHLGVQASGWSDVSNPSLPPPSPPAPRQAPQRGPTGVRAY